MNSKINGQPSKQLLDALPQNIALTIGTGADHQILPIAFDGKGMVVLQSGQHLLEDKATLLASQLRFVYFPHSGQGQG